MDGLFWLSQEQLERIKPCFPKSRGVRRVDDRKVLGGIIYVLRNGLRWVDAPAAYGPYKTLYNRFRRWSVTGVFQLIFSELSRPEDTEAGGVLMVEPPTSKPIAPPPASKRGRRAAFDRSHQRGLTSKLHVARDRQGRPVRLHLSEGQCSDFTGADVLLRDLPEASVLIGDKGQQQNPHHAAGARHHSLHPRQAEPQPEDALQQEALQAAP